MIAFLHCNIGLQVTGFMAIYVSLNRVVQPRRASVRELSAFHSLDYIECLAQLASDDECEEVEDVASEYGLGMTALAPAGERETPL